MNNRIANIAASIALSVAVLTSCTPGTESPATACKKAGGHQVAAPGGRGAPACIKSGQPIYPGLQ